MSDPVARVKQTRVDEIETIPMPFAYTFHHLESISLPPSPKSK